MGIQTKNVKYIIDPSFQPEPEAGCSKASLDISLQALDESPLKLHGVAQHQRTKTAKVKLQKVVSKLEERVACAFKVDVKELNKPQIAENPNNATKVADLDKLTLSMKEKIKQADYKMKIQILTLTPESWSRKYASEYFEVSEYLIRIARTLKKYQGILAVPLNKIGKILPNDVIQLVELFYQDDEYSRLMPGKKDYVSVGKRRGGRVHEQKRLLLCNLHELYTLFKEKNPDVKIGFSKFCSLRPKWCVSAGSAGTHSVCVCTHHQNTILLLTAIKWNITYKDLMEKIVCDTLSNECMVHRCEQCPGTEALRNYLDQELQEIDVDEEFHFNQWQSTDRSQLITQTVTVEEYKDQVIESVDKLTAHSYIAKCQAKFLKDLKIELEDNECIVLGDFAENYEFVVQDEIQSYHWSKDSCTLHPIVVYFKIPGEKEIQHKSFCFMSDDRNHDTCFVYEVQKLLISYIKENMSRITKFF